MTNPLPGKNKKIFFTALMIFFAASALIIILGYNIYQNQKTYINNAAGQQLTAIAELKVWEINNWRNERIGDASVIYKNNVFASDVMQYFNNPSSSEAKINILSLLSATQKSYNYKNILLLDERKKIRLALNKYDFDFGKIHSNVINEAADKINTHWYCSNRSRSSHTLIPGD
jgi:hypothetical protein